MPSFLAFSSISLDLDTRFLISSTYFATASLTKTGTISLVHPSSLYKLLPLDSIFNIANLSISSVLLICVPPHNSIESPILTTLTISLYLSVNRAIAPSALASSKVILDIWLSILSLITSLTLSSILIMSSSLILPV